MNEQFIDIFKSLNKKIYSHEKTAKTPMMSTNFEKTKKEIIDREKTDNYLPRKAIIKQVK